MQIIRNPTRYLNSMSFTKIGTHNGPFHCDEVLACLMLRKLDAYKNAQIVRSRDPKVLSTCDTVVDVGGVYDHSKRLYDHHQREFTDTIASFRKEFNSQVKLSSAGLIYHHYGEEVLQKLLTKPVDDKTLSHLFKYVYEHFIKEIDAVDNGVPMYESGTPLYNFNTNLSARVGRLHPPWNARVDSEENWMTLFDQATKIVEEELMHFVSYFEHSHWPARVIVQTAVDQRFSTHESGEIIEVPLCPWKSHVFDIEDEQGISGAIKYAIFDDGASWRVQAVPLTPGNYVLRNALHPSWQGVRDDKLISMSGVSDAIFIHATGFIGGAKSRAGAMELAERSLEYYKNEGCQNGK